MYHKYDTCRAAHVKKSRKSVCNCCLKGNSSTSSEGYGCDSIDLNNEYDYYIEKLVVHRAPLSLTGTREDVEERKRRFLHPCQTKKRVQFVQHRLPKQSPCSMFPEPPRLISNETQRSDDDIYTNKYKRRKPKIYRPYDSDAQYHCLDYRRPRFGREHLRLKAPPRVICEEYEPPRRSQYRFYRTQRNACVQTCDQGPPPRNVSFFRNPLFEREDSSCTPRPVPQRESCEPPPAPRRISYVHQSNPCKCYPAEERNIMSFFKRRSKTPQHSWYSMCPERDEYRCRREEFVAYPLIIADSPSPFVRRAANLSDTHKQESSRQAVENNAPQLSSGDALMVSSSRLRPTPLSKCRGGSIIASNSLVLQRDESTRSRTRQIRPRSRCRQSGKIYIVSDHRIHKINETRFKAEPEERTYIVSRSDENSTNPHDGAASTSKDASAQNKKTSKNPPNSQKNPQQQNGAGPSHTGHVPTLSTNAPKMEPKATTSSTSLAPILTKASLKSTSFAVNRDVLDDENKPIPPDVPQPGKPLFVNISGKSLTKKDTHQILNKYSSIFVENIKDPIPKDPLRPDADDEAGPSNLGRNPDLATKLSEIGSTQFRKVPNTVYVTPTQPHRPLPMSQSVESIVERIHQYEAESPSSRNSVEEVRPDKLNSKNRSVKNRSSKTELPKPGTSKAGPSKQECSKANSSKPTPKVGEKSERENTIQKEAENPKSAKAPPQDNGPTYPTQFCQISNINQGRHEELKTKGLLARPTTASTIVMESLRDERSLGIVVNTRRAKHTTKQTVPKNECASLQQAATTSPHESMMEKSETESKKNHGYSPSKCQSGSKRSTTSSRGQLSAISAYSSNESESPFEIDKRTSMIVNAHISPPERDGKDKKRWKIVIKHQNDTSKDSQNE